MENDSISLAGRTALVTGGAVRLGRAVAVALAEASVNVVVHYNTSRRQAESLVEQLQQTGVGAWAIGADLTEPGQAENLMEQAVSLAGGVDILINNASVFELDRIMDMTPQGLWNNMQIHAIAPLLLARAFAAQQAHTAQGALWHIINFLDSRIGDYDKEHISYHLSKRVLQSLTCILAAELGPVIAVNAIAPGLILPPKGQGDSYLEKLAHTNPLNRHGCERDITDAVLFLLRSSFITGQTIFIDGGRHMKGNMYG